MKRILSTSLTFLLAISIISISITPSLVLAQEKLNNQSVISMVKNGLSAEIIIAKIKSSPSSFDTSSNALQALKKAGVSDSIVLAMVRKESGLAEETVTNTSSGGTMTANVKMPDGTEVKLVTVEEISSKKAVVDDQLTFKVAEDVKVDGKIVIAKDAIAKGVVTTAKKKGMMGRSGELSIRLESVQTVDAQKVKLRSSKSGEGGDKTTSTIVLTVLFGPLGLLKRGKDAVIKSGTVLTTFTDEAKDVVVRY